MPPPQQPGDDGPSEEEVRQYLAQMRGAPADQVIAEVLQGLLNAAQVKLGRNDARLLLDATAGLMDSVRGRVDDQLATQVDQALSQLRMAQVEAEQEVAGRPESEPNDAPSPGAGAQPPAGGPQQPQPGQPGGARPSGGQQGGGASPLDKLWIPGR